MRLVMVSGGFDPLHIGHLDMIEAAHRLGNVVAVVNSDEWLIRKKGYALMPFADRLRIVRELRTVTAVTGVDDADDTICKALIRLKPDIFVNGGDRTEAHPAEAETCEILGIEQRFGIGGGKVRSSSELVKAARGMVPFKFSTEQRYRLSFDMESGTQRVVEA